MHACIHTYLHKYMHSFIHSFSAASGPCPSAGSVLQGEAYREKSSLLGLGLCVLAGNMHNSMKGCPCVSLCMPFVTHALLDIENPTPGKLGP